jgi:Holliday junction resolvase RusA-like endonuclease
MDGGGIIAPVVRIVIPGVPKAWERAGHRIARTGDGKQFVSTYTPAQTRSEQGAMKLFANRAMEGRPPLDGAIDLRLCAFMPVPRSWSGRKQQAALSGEIRPTGKPDADNLLKQVDALTGIVFRDDAQITEATVWKRYSDQPRMVIEVRQVGSAA